MKKTIMTMLGLALAIPAAAWADCPSLQKVDPASWTCVKSGDAEGSSVVLFAYAGAWAKFWKQQTGQEQAPAADFGAELIAVKTAPDGSFRAEKVARGSQQAAYWQEQAARSAASQAGAQAEGRVSQALQKVRFAVLGEDSSSAGQGQSMGSVSGFDGSVRDAVGGATPFAVQSAGQAGAKVGGKAGTTKPSQLQSQCTPGVDCPQNGGGQAPNCTRGVDCPGDGNGGNGNGNAPLPPNYQTRPSNPPGSFPPIGSPTYHDNPVDVAGYWHPYFDWLGRPEEDYGNWSHTTGSAVVERGGKEVGSQGTDYTATLESQAERNVYRLYWRYVGQNCNPQDTTQCVSWSVEYAWFYDRTQSGTTRSVTVEVVFVNDKALLPWEKETIRLTYDGSQVNADTSGAAYNYSVNGPIVNQQKHTAVIELTPTSRILRRPEANKVSMTLVKGGTGLQLVVDDSRDAFYDGETLELTVQVKMDSGHWYSRDKVVFERKDNGPIRVRIAAGKHPQSVIDLGSQGSGKYYIKSWSFRRAQSKISDEEWVDRGKGNEQQL